MSTQFRSSAAALVLLALVACLAVANRHRPKVESTTGSSAVAPERERSNISLALEVAHGAHAGTIVRISARAAFSLAEGLSGE